MRSITNAYWRILHAVQVQIYCNFQGQNQAEGQLIIVISLERSPISAGNN